MTHIEIGKTALTRKLIPAVLNEPGGGSNSLNRPPAAAAGRGRGGFAPDPSRMKQGELSGKDALNVLDLVTKEYPIDADRVYLFGHSAGGARTWYFGEKYAEK
jgi:hypothetical protein